MKRFFRKNKKIAYGLLALAMSIIVAIELLVGWENVLIMTGHKPSPITENGMLEVHFIDVGNADSILIRQADKAMLIDAGERGDHDDILTYFQQHGVDKLDLVIATHPHADHVGAMGKIINAIPVDRFVMSFMPEGATPTAAVYEEMLVALDKKNVAIEEAHPGAVYQLGDARVQLLAPISESDDANDMSVVARLTFGSHAFLFTGDAGKAVEKELMKSGCDLRADVMKLSHHGSNTANTAAFLKKVLPRYAVITCGKDNNYGHPHQEVIDRLNRQNVPVCRSDALGDIVFYSDGQSLRVETERGVVRE